MARNEKITVRWTDMNECMIHLVVDGEEVICAWGPTEQEAKREYYSLREQHVREGVDWTKR
jgi:hypothetical protein